MLLKYRYKLKPYKNPTVTIFNLLELSKKQQYNYRLVERLDWFEATRTPVNAYSVNVSVLPIDRNDQNILEFRVQKQDGIKKDSNGNLITKKGNKYRNIVNGYVLSNNFKLADLQQTKKLCPEYKSIYSQVLQQYFIQRFKITMDDVTLPNKNSKTSGRLKFKGKHYYNSFSYPQLSKTKIFKNAKGRFCISLSKLGLVHFLYNFLITEGLKVKTGTVIHEADGCYISLTLEDKTILVEDVKIQPTQEKSKGIDLGLLYHVLIGEGEFIEVLKFFIKYEHRLSKIQVRLAKKSKQSKPGKIFKGKIAKLNQLIARQLKNSQLKLAWHLFSVLSLIFLEDLQILNLFRRYQAKLGKKGQFLPNGKTAKSGLNKSWQDLGFGKFIQVLEYVSGKEGKRIITVDKSYTSQYFGECLNKVPKIFSELWHSYPKCCKYLDRDYNSALPNQKIGLLSKQGEDITSVKTVVGFFLTKEPHVVA